MLISLIGAPGVGKSTVAKLLANELGYVLIEENFQNNPFLPEAWANIQASKPDMSIIYNQLWFIGQYAKIMKSGIKNAIIDSGPHMAYIFTTTLERLNLIDHNVSSTLLNTYKSLTPPEGKVFKLELGTEETLKRINTRGRKFEANCGENSGGREYVSQIIDSVYDYPAIRISASGSKEQVTQAILAHL